MKKYLAVILLFTGRAFSQVAEEEHQLVRNTLANMTIRWDLAIKANKDLNENIKNLLMELQAIKEPSAELIVILKKYNIYKEK